MSYPKPSNRAYSMYTSDSENSNTVPQAHRDLDRCAHILAQVLDDGDEILDAVKKRKIRSPAKNQKRPPVKRTKQTNRLITSDSGRISSSTPQHTSRASTKCSSHVTRQRSRSLSQQRLPSNRRRSESLTRPTISTLTDSTNSLRLNLSHTSSEADTLTGVHLDNSSQFGIPPVFSSKHRDVTQKRRGRSRSVSSSKPARRKDTGKVKAGWIRAQKSSSTQTMQSSSTVSDRGDLDVISRPSGVTKTSGEANVKSTASSDSKTPSPIRIPGMELLSPVTQVENDIDDIIAERTLIEEKENIPTNSNPNTNVNSSDSNHTFQELIKDFQRAWNNGDKTEADCLFKDLAETMRFPLNRESHSSMDMIISLQAENQDLRTKIRILEQSSPAQISHNSSSPDPAQDIRIKLLSCETHLARVLQELDEERNDNQLLRRDNLYKQENVEDLTRARNIEKEPEGKWTANLRQRLCHAEQHLKRLQQTLRLFHTRLSCLSADCSTTTATQIHAILELCAQRLVDSMGTLPSLNQNNNTNQGRSKLIAELANNYFGPSSCKPGQVSYPPGLNREQSTSDVLKPGKLLSGATDTVSRDFSPSVTKPSFSSSPLLAKPSHTCPPMTYRDKEFNPHNVPKLPNDVSTSSRYSMTHYFKSYHPASYDKILSSGDNSQDLEQHPISSSEGSFHEPPSSTTRRVPPSFTSPNRGYHSEQEQLHNVALENSLSSINDSQVQALDVSTNGSTLSLATTVADSVFQDGLAQLDANIARLQDSLRASLVDPSF